MTSAFFDKERDSAYIRVKAAVVLVLKWSYDLSRNTKQVRKALTQIAKRGNEKMYAPSIYGDVTVTVTGEIASALIKSAGLGEARDDCWLLRDGTTTIVAKTALTDALVVIAEDPTETVQTPSAHHEAPASQRTSQQARTSAKGSSPMRDFLLKTLDHDAIIDEVIDLLFEHVELQLLNPSNIGEQLRTIIYRAIGGASANDWRWVTEALIAEACETLGIEHPLDRTPPGAETPHQPDRRTRALRNLDPGVLRERLAAIYAQGASQGARSGVRWIVRHISRLTGLSRAEIEADAKADAEVMNELIHVGGDNRVSSEDRGSGQAATSASVSCWPLRQLSGREAEALLEKGTDSTDPAIRLRCGVILAVNAGVSPSHLAVTRQTSVEHIIRIVSEFNERGLSSVEDSQ